MYLGLDEESTKLYHCFFKKRDDVEALLSLLPALNFDHIVNLSVNIQWDAENMKLVKDGVGFLIKMGHRVFVSVRYRLLLGPARAAFPSFQ